MGQQFLVEYDDMEEFNKKYNIGEKIGSGAFGIVNALAYKQKDPNNEQLVIKQLRCNDKYSKKYQENEIESFKKIQLLPQEYRKRIIEVKNVYWDSNNTQIIMILPRAQCSFFQEINTRIKDNIPYSEEELCFKMSCVLEGLLTFKSLGMVHRDIKASNILVMKDGSLKIADLGTVKNLDNEISPMTIKIGTYKYWSPEQIEIFLKLKEQNYYEYLQTPEAKKDFRTSDQYALGLCFVFAATLSQIPVFQDRENDNIYQYKKERQIWLKKQFDQLRKEKIYSTDLIYLLENLVNEDYKERWSLIKCCQKLCEITKW